MNWETFFEIGENVTANEAKQFMSSGETERYQLLDVRQPKEYEQAHIPGAILIPLAELPQRQSELDRKKPIIVYCRSGVRSKSGAQILTMNGFPHVFNMKGGILEWHGEESFGDVETGLEYFVNGDFGTSFALAVQMEYGLQQFYQTLARQAVDEDEKEMLLQLARLEDGHIAKLMNKYQQFDIQPEKNEHAILEGSLDVNDMLSRFADQLGSPENVLQLSMKLEAQAFDLYCRLAREHHGTESAAFYREMANEEQQHLLRLSRQLDALFTNT